MKRFALFLNACFLLSISDSSLASEKAETRYFCREEKGAWIHTYYHADEQYDESRGPGFFVDLSLGYQDLMDSPAKYKGKCRVPPFGEGLSDLLVCNYKKLARDITIKLTRDPKDKLVFTFVDQSSRGVTVWTGYCKEAE